MEKFSKTGTLLGTEKVLSFVISKGVQLTNFKLVKEKPDQ